MKTIFEASSGLEAYMILNLLQREGIESRVDGEYLQGGIGELQAMNLARVLVEESDYEKARTIINEWESTQIDNTDYHTPVKKSSGIGTGLFFGILIGTGMTFLAYNSPVTSDSIDYNYDGQFDEKWTYRDDRIYRVDVDRNLDGDVDAIHHYNNKGIIFKTETDDNFDGVYETVYKYSRGNVYTQESDLNHDGDIDYRGYFENGLVSEIEILGPDSSIPKKKQIYKMNKLVSSEYDSNGDGVYDIIYEYDYYEEIKTKSNKSPKSRTPQSGALRSIVLNQRGSVENLASNFSHLSPQHGLWAEFNL